MLQNVIAGLQGIIDHAMVGHYVGYTSNRPSASAGRSSSSSSSSSRRCTRDGRARGPLHRACEPEKVNRVVQQAFLTSMFLSVVLAIAGTCSRRTCSTWCAPRPM